MALFCAAARDLPRVIFSPASPGRCLSVVKWRVVSSDTAKRIATRRVTAIIVLRSSRGNVTRAHTPTCVCVCLCEVVLKINIPRERNNMGVTCRGENVRTCAIPGRRLRDSNLPLIQPTTTTTPTYYIFTSARTRIPRAEAGVENLKGASESPTGDDRCLGEIRHRYPDK